MAPADFNYRTFIRANNTTSAFGKHAQKFEKIIIDFIQTLQRHIIKLDFGTALCQKRLPLLITLEI
jgi:hypothetical protein